MERVLARAYFGRPVGFPASPGGRHTWLGLAVCTTPSTTANGVLGRAGVSVHDGHWFLWVYEEVVGF